MSSLIDKVRYPTQPSTKQTANTLLYTEDIWLNKMQCLLFLHLPKTGRYGTCATCIKDQLLHQYVFSLRLNTLLLTSMIFSCFLSVTVWHYRWDFGDEGLKALLDRIVKVILVLFNTP